MSDIELDQLKAMVDLYREAQARIKEWEEIAKKARTSIEERMGESEVGTIDGKPAIRWVYINSTRLDQTLLKGQHPDVYQACQTTSTSRRFEPVKS